MSFWRALFTSFVIVVGSFTLIMLGLIYLLSLSAEEDVCQSGYAYHQGICVCGYER